MYDIQQGLYRYDHHCRQEREKLIRLYEGHVKDVRKSLLGGYERAPHQDSALTWDNLARWYDARLREKSEEFTQAYDRLTQHNRELLYTWYVNNVHGERKLGALDPMDYKINPSNALPW